MPIFHFAAVPATDVVGDRTVEIESRLADNNDLGPLHTRSTSWWLAPTVGLSDSVELQLPVEMTWLSETGMSPSFSLTRFATDLRYHFGHTVSSVFRAGLSRDVQIRNLARVDLELAVSYDIGDVKLAAAADLGFEANRGGVHLEARPSAGVHVRIHDDLRAGAEVFGLYSADAAAETYVAAGPSFAFTHGRFWAASSLGIGIHSIATAGRLTWGARF